ncbi:MAG: HU family DNA-binding protein [Bacteroidota bacterium]|nr:integration host factor subunit beta [Candidatus Kapabacteria bacterium]MDW8220628.1 HU family DNA-binding protein [Bacteroidota bacterium]
MKSVTKANIVQRIAAATGMTKVEVDAVVEGFLNVVSDALTHGERIELRDFGVFAVKKRRPRAARNPRTGDPVELEERFVPTFKVSRKLRARVDTRLKSGQGKSLKSGQGKNGVATKASAYVHNV